MRIAADIGGTFTDMVAIEPDGRYHYLKLPSTPGEYERAVFEGVDRLLAESEQSSEAIDRVVHGTTVATNAILERSGPATGLLTTSGFRDVLEIGRLRIPNSYDLFWSKPPPLARRRHRAEINERIAADGSVLKPLDPTEVEDAVAAMRADGVTTIAISFLNSYTNPAHEQTASAVVGQRYPDVLVTTGTEVVGELGEFERTSTAVLNAYLRPVVSDYLGRLVGGLKERGLDAATLVMQSSGGMMPLIEARQHPVHILESGPAAGAVAAARIAEQAGLHKVVAFDMGGTTAKATLIEDFQLPFGSEFSVGSEVSAMSRLLRGGGYAVRLPSIDLAEVGAGGGSIARVDAAGGLEVGPQSAGAEPGPACYSKGGELPTVTDANLLLGYVSPDGLRPGGIDVDAERARRAIEARVAEPLGLDVRAASEAIHVVADLRMARAIRAVSTERGRDLSSYALVAFGGSGPIHAASLADAVGIRTVVVPPLAGVLSAVGLIWSPVQLTQVESFGLPLAAALQVLPGRRAAAERQLRDRLAASRFGESRVEIIGDADIRYAGQAYDLTIRLPSGEPKAEALRAAFLKQYQQTYGHAPEAPLELVRLRLTARVADAPPAFLRSATTRTAGETSRAAIFNGACAEVAVLARDQVRGTMRGPCLVDDLDTTTVVPPGWTVRLDGHANLLLERSQ
jgi:N-methylhydantoinase A